MSEQIHLWRESLSGGRELSLETGKIARQAHGSILMRLGKAVLMVTATSNAKPAAHLDFFPLTVEYREKMAAAGRIPGGFLRREARAGDHEILTSRLIDRTIRPFFPDGYRNETQLLANLLSYDPGIDFRSFAITAASMALCISDIPWGGPLVGIHLVYRDDRFILFPTRAEQADAELDLIMSLSTDGLVMVEGDCLEVPEEKLIAAFDAAQEAAAPLLALQTRMREEAGKEKREFEPSTEPTEQLVQAGELIRDRATPLFSAMEKKARNQLRSVIVDETARKMISPDGDKDDEIDAGQLAEMRSIASQAMRYEIRRQTIAGNRLDGRCPADVRSISGEVAWLPSVHGSSIFSRGETQALLFCTLGTAENEQMVEDLNGLRKESFLLHYNFPGYSVGEVKPLRGPGRREIGHGNLARRAMLPVLPSKEDYPFTIRLESEITSSNGSSSMATVCGGILALMDAGVPIKRPVAGIAMGLIADGENTVVLTDILGDEDHLGDMDFKITGTSEGITAVQMDNKIGSLSRGVLERALEQARIARLHILDEMTKICPKVRPEPPAQAPRVSFLQIRPNRIRDLIGPGGKHIKGLEQETGVKLDVAQDGGVRIYGPPGAKLKDARKRINYLTGEPKVGAVYRGRVTGVKDFGCFVEIFHGIEGLVHISELAAERVDSAERIASSGDEMIVKVLGAKDGKLELSRKAALGEEVTQD
jgi:polyribonucleotide nucleotidyltransferase